MSFIKTLSTVLISILVVTASAFAQDNAETVKKELNTYNDRYNEIVQSHDVDTFVGLYSNNPLWISPTDAPVAGLELPRNTLQFLADNDGKLHHTADHVFVSSDGSQAVLIGKYDVAVEKFHRKADGTYLLVLARKNEGWDIVVDMYNEHVKK